MNDRQIRTENEKTGAETQSPIVRGYVVPWDGMREFSATGLGGGGGGGGEDRRRRTDARTKRGLPFLRETTPWERSAPFKDACHRASNVFLKTYKHIILRRILRGPVACGRFKGLLVGLVLVGNLRHQRILRVGIGQKRRYRQQNSGNSESRAPLVFQNVQTDSSVLVDLFPGKGTAKKFQKNRQKAHTGQLPSSTTTAPTTRLAWGYSAATIISKRIYAHLGDKLWFGM